MALTLKENEFINAETMEVETRPVTEEKKEEATTDEKKEEESEEKEPEKVEAKKEEADQKESEEEESEEESEEETEKKSEEEESESEEEEKEEEVKAEDDAVTVDDFLAEKYAKQFDIKNEEDLDAVLGTIEEITQENETLKSEVAELKKGSDKPKFSSEQEEKAFEFLKTFDVSRLSEGMQTFAKVITMDVKTAEPRILLEEKFILENPELTRDEALKVFNRDFNKKYTVKKEDFDDDASFKEEEDFRKIELKKDVAKAKEYLEKKQTELKAKPKEVENTEAKENVVVQKSIKANVSELDGFMTEFNEIIFSPSDKEEDDFRYKLNKDQLKLVHESCKGWIGNPNSYDSKGNLIGNEEFDVEEKIKQTAYILFGEDMIEKALKHGLSIGEIKQADKIATKKPTRVSKGGNGELKGLSEEQQWEEILKKKKQRKQIA